MKTQRNKIKILIADDHAVVREGTRKILEHEPDLEVVAEASDGEEAVRLTGAHKPDVAIIDIAMPGVNGLEATRQIKNLYPAVAVLILTAFDDDQFVFGLLEAGAAGYLLKSVRGRELVEAVRQVHAGESVLYPSIARKVLNRFSTTSSSREDGKPPEVLTEREREVLQLATWGMSNQEIADRLVLSLHTIQAHLGHIFNKLQVGSRTEAVVHALRKGWVTLDDNSRDPATKE
ncbi:MAG: response regulator transcription factor [Dehalococcoidales bacterium]|nr:response regulator transcription factor [Dehalococcoidales bacterium]